MGKGIEMARAAGAGLHADVLDDFKDQLIIVLMKRLQEKYGDSLVFSVAEVDETGLDLLAFKIDEAKNFVFTLGEKIMSGCENGLTTDPKHEDLGHGADDKPVAQNKCYLVLSEEERAKGFVRPVRYAYRHVGIPGPKFPTVDVTEEERQRYGWGTGPDEFAKFETYPAGHSSTGRYWTQAELDSVGKGCGTITTMGRALSETYARNPGFYGSTYCCGCSMHRPVGEDGEFVWEGTEERVGA